MPPKMFETYVREAAVAADAASDDYRRTAPDEANRTMMIVALTSAVALTLINFFAKDPAWVSGAVSGVGLNPVRVNSWLSSPDSAQLARLSVWTLVQLLAYVALPVLAIKFLIRKPIAEFGVAVRGIASHWRPYFLLFLVSLPVVIWASYSEAFLAKYPFYDLSPGEGLWPNMVVWWVMYAAQFVALEFFFRGFMVHGLKWRMGYAAIFVMVIPYNMIHFAKPLAEAFGAILGGVTLGTLSLRTNSVWWGAALHIAVAATMDIAALTHQGVLWP
ncbi:MAG: CPBP family intramembrane metalloprotease [Acidimicrobiia bacterium]|nr:CPBP family intramembrane metalloprotease [Acidimicrobiia bacterium]MDH5503285.1 CPBP family intramembrane metalloprotease [Acidimicrobiia bacterium]